MLVFLFFCNPAAGFAQPGFDANIPRLVEAHQRSIAELDKQIAARPAGGQLYFKRAKEFAGIYRVLYKDYVAETYADRAHPLPTVAYLTAKAIADLDRAIKAGPSTEMYNLRGDMHFAHWQTQNQIDWNKLAAGNNADPEWSDLIGEPDEKKLLDTFGKFIADDDFLVAVADYSRALQGVLDKDTRRWTSNYLAELYIRRAFLVPIQFPVIKRLVTGPNQFQYSIMGDLDNAIKYFSNLWPYKYGEDNHYLVAGAGVATVADLYFSKAKLAMALGLYPTGLEAFKIGASRIGDDDSNGSIACEFYSKYADLLVKMGDPGAAIEAAGKATVVEPAAVCTYAHEPLGDAWFGKGEFEKAAAEYQIALKYPYNSPSPADLYRKSAIALNKAGNPADALKAMTSYIHDPEANPSVADYRLRSQLYRDAGHRGLGMGDEQRAAALEREYGSSGIATPVGGVVYGKVVMPDGKPVGDNIVGVNLKYADGTINRETGLDAKGRFVFRHVKNVSFTLSAFANITTPEINGRYTGSAAISVATNGTAGPIIITLTKSKQPGSFLY